MHAQAGLQAAARNVGAVQRVMCRALCPDAFAFAAGVPWNTTDDTLEQHFAQFGRVEEAQIMREKYTGKVQLLTTAHNKLEAQPSLNQPSQPPEPAWPASM